MEESIKIISPVNVLEIQDMENWLQEMAAKGYHIESIGLLYVHFTYKRPTFTPVRYRIMPAPRLFLRNTDPNINDAWHEVPSQSSFIKIYVCYNENAEDLYPDDATKSDIFNKICKKARLVALFVFLFPIFILLLLRLFVNNMTQQPILSLIETDYFSFLIFLFPMIYLSLQQLHEIRTIYRQDNYWGYISKPYHPGLSFMIKAITSGLILVIGLFTIFNDDLFQKEISASIPAIALESFEENKDYLYQKDSSTVFIDQAFTPLAPVQYKVQQQITMENKQNPDQSEFYEPTIETEYYELFILYLAKPLMQELIETATAKVLEYPKLYGTLEMTELKNTGFDRAVLLKYGYNQQLIAVTNNQVISVTYDGFSDLASVVDEIQTKVKTLQTNSARS